MPKYLMGNCSVFRAAWRLGLVAILAGYLILPDRAQATGQFICNTSTSSNGSTTWISCGSSAGNYMYSCDSSGNCNQYPDNQYNQGLADYNCAKYAASGCPADPLETEPLPEEQPVR